MHPAPSANCYHSFSSAKSISCVNSVSPMTNSATWFDRACVGKNQKFAWTVFPCYDTDEYNSNITKFHEGDWAMFRKSIASSAQQEE